MLHPAEAKSMVKYRVDRMKGAAHKAAMNGYAGLMFPWESAFSGEEVQGQAYNQVGPWGSFEQHISSDVSLAAWQYWKATNDSAFLSTSLSPLILGVADFWESRVTLNTSEGHYHIYNVMGPDEYAWPVNDSAYTNVAAMVVLQNAVEVAEAMRFNDSAKVQKWLDIAQKMFVPFDEELQYHPENGM